MSWRRAQRSGAVLVALSLAGGVLLRPKVIPAAPPRCPDEMALIAGRFCVDRHEASLEVVDEAGQVVGPHPHNREVGTKRVRAVSRAGVFPQAYINRDEAQAACARAEKRLCADDEWLTACQGSTPTTYPYGPRRRSGACNDEGVSPLRKLHGPVFAHDHSTLNDPRLDAVAGTVARAGHFARCTAGNGVVDMVGNVHEWTSAPDGVFRGGYFLDTHTLGDGCHYVTTGHAPSYHDYSTGFRCCRDAQ